MKILGLGFLFWFTAILLPLLLVWSDRRDRLSAPLRRLWWALALLVAAAPALRMGRVMALRVTVPTEWDFLTYWFGARVAAQGLNFYDPLVYQSQPLPIAHPTFGFVTEILQVGYAYPPTSMLLMLPLGWFDYSTAFGLWYAVTTLALAGALVLLWRSLFPERAFADLALIVALALVFEPTVDTVSWGQSSFLILLVLALAYRARERVSGPVWLALGVTIKPFVAGPLAWFALRRQWRGLLAAALTGVLLMAAAVALFGWDTCSGFFYKGAVGRYAPHMYVQEINQSLIAVTLRGLGAQSLAEAPLAPWIIGAAALAIAAATAFAVWRAGKDGAIWSFNAVLLAVLLAYPHSLDHYSVAALPTVFALWAWRDRVPGGAAAAIALIVAFYLLHAWNQNAVFGARLMLWATTVAMAFRAGAAQAKRPAPQGAGLAR